MDERVQDISASTWVVGWLVGWRVGDVGHRVDWDGKAGIMLLCPDWPRSAFCLVHVTTGLLCSPCYNYHQSQSDLLRWSLKLKAYYTFLYKNAHLLLFQSLLIPTSGQKKRERRDCGKSVWSKTQSRQCQAKVYGRPTWSLQQSLHNECVRQDYKVSQWHHHCRFWTVFPESTFTEKEIRVLLLMFKTIKFVDT